MHYTQDRENNIVKLCVRQYYERYVCLDIAISNININNRAIQAISFRFRIAKSAFRILHAEITCRLLFTLIFVRRLGNTFFTRYFRATTRKCLLLASIPRIFIRKLIDTWWDFLGIYRIYNWTEVIGVFWNALRHSKYFDVYKKTVQDLSSLFSLILTLKNSKVSKWYNNT